MNDGPLGGLCSGGYEKDLILLPGGELRGADGSLELRLTREKLTDCAPKRLCCDCKPAGASEPEWHALGRRCCRTKPFDLAVVCDLLLSRSTLNGLEAT